MFTFHQTQTFQFIISTLTFLINYYYFPYVKNIVIIVDYNLPKIYWLPSLYRFFPNLINLNKTDMEILSILSFF